MSPRERLVEATASLIREEGLVALSSRSIATRAQVNQSLIFYHFRTVPELVSAACRQAVDESAEQYEAAFAQVAAVGDLIAVARDLHARERASGNVRLMAQLMSAGQTDETYAVEARYAMRRWKDELLPVVERVLSGNALAELVDPAGVTAAVTSAFVGLLLYEGIEFEAAQLAFDTLERLALAVELVDSLGPVGRRALRSKLRASRRRTPRG